MRAFVTAEWTAEGVQALERLGYEVRTGGWGVTRHALDTEALVAAAREVELLVVEVETVDAAVLDRLPGLRVLGSARGSPANVDLDACSVRGIPVLHTPARNADSVADFVIRLTLTICRGISAGEQHLRGHGWMVRGELPYLHFRGPELAGLTLGLIGRGAVGRAVERRARSGFGMRVIFHDPYVDGSVPLDELLATSDIVSLHCPRSPETVGLIGAKALAAMKPTAYLVNTAGGACVDEVALVEALAEGAIAGAALDVYAIEPLPPDSPLLGCPGLVLTPHLAGAADDVVRHHTELLCADLTRLSAGQPPLHCANPQAL
ncbi:MAG: NAD(P)-dependent oxidoreductase [Egibacteraceae bacterium]